MDVNRYQQDLATLSPGHQLSLLNLSAIDPRFGDGFLNTWTLGLERQFAGLTADAAYVGTSAFSLPRSAYPNGYAAPARASPPTPSSIPAATPSAASALKQSSPTTAHSSYNALQTSLAGTVPHGGPGLQAGYTWAKSIDDVSAVFGGTGSPAPSPSQPRRIPSTTTPNAALPISTSPTASRSAQPRIFLSAPPALCALRSHRWLGAAQHLQHQQRLALYRLLGNPADRRRRQRS